MTKLIELTHPKHRCSYTASCPGVWKTEDGKFYEIQGDDVTEPSAAGEARIRISAEILEAAVAEPVAEARRQERREIMVLLGYDENGIDIGHQEGQFTIIDAVALNLEAVISDLQRLEADKVCIKTLEKIRVKLQAVVDRAAALHHGE